MKVSELVDRLAKMDGDAEVCISVTNCLSAYTAEPVEGVQRGFDWTAGKVVFEPKRKLQRVQEACKRCALCTSRLGERIMTRLYRDDERTCTLSVLLDGKQKVSVKIDTGKKGEDNGSN